MRLQKKDMHYYAAHAVEQSRLHASLFLLAFGLLFAPAYSFFTGSPLRFIVYALPIISFALAWILSKGSRFYFNGAFASALVLYIVAILPSIFLQYEPIGWITWINAFKPIFYIIAFIPLMQFTGKSVDGMVLIFALTTVFLWVSGGGTTRGGLDFASSQGLLESGLAFPLGGIFIYCLIFKKRILSVITFLLFFIAFKRIAFSAVIIVLFLYVLTRGISMLLRVRERVLLYIFIPVMIIGAGLANMYYYDFFALLSDILGSEATVSEFTMGRLLEYQILSAQYQGQSVLNILFGNGPGDSTRKLVEVTIDYPLQVHNSYLLYFYDYGIVGFAILLLAFFMIFKQNTFGLYLFLYNLLVMITDNTFIHHFHLISYFILISAAGYEWQHASAYAKRSEQTTLPRRRYRYFRGHYSRA